MFKNKYILGFSFLFTLGLTFGQQTKLSSLYAFNPVLVNPAESGFNNQTDISLSFRKQWTGYSGAPTSGWVSGHTAIRHNMGLGGVFNYDEMSFVKNIDAKLYYGYHLKLAADFKLSFGLGAGIQQSSINLSNIMADDYTDEILAAGNSSGVMFDAIFGSVITYKEFKLGVSLPQLLKPSVDIATSTIETDYNLESHLNVYINYKSKINNSVTALPTIMYRRSAASSQFDVLANFLFNEHLILGLGYREGVGILANVGAKIKDKFQVNYAYDFGKAGFGTGTSGSHEIMLKMYLKSAAPEILEEEEDESEEQKTKEN